MDPHHREMLLRVMTERLHPIMMQIHDESMERNERTAFDDNMERYLTERASTLFAEAYDIFINNNSDSSLTSQDSGFSRRSDSEAIESPSEPSISIDSAIVTTSHNNAESPAQHSNQLNLVPVSTANGVSSGVIVNEGAAGQQPQALNNFHMVQEINENPMPADVSDEELDMRPNKCNRCDLSFRRRNALDSHIRNVHCTCENCGRAFDTEVELSEHQNNNCLQF